MLIRQALTRLRFLKDSKIATCCRNLATTVSQCKHKKGADKELLVVRYTYDGQKCSFNQNIPADSTLSKLHLFLEQFLPKDHETSTRVGYTSYVPWQMSSSVLSCAGGILSMQALLMSLGFGSSETAPAAAAINWILKDGLGQFGGVLFASLVSNKFDANPSVWRMVSAVALELSSFLEMFTLLFPALFLPIASIANIGKNISYLSASASRAAIHKSFALRENLADITAKAGSQTIVASLLGTSVGLTLATALNGDTTMIFSTFLGLSFSSLYCMHRSFDHVVISTLDRNRLHMLFDYHMANNKGDSSSGSYILSPNELSQYLKSRGQKYYSNFRNIYSERGVPILIGEPINVYIKSEAQLSDLLSEQSYCDVTCSPQNLVRGYLHAYMVAKSLHCPNRSCSSSDGCSNTVKGLELSSTIIQNGRYIDRKDPNGVETSLDSFVELLFSEQQWNIDESLIEVEYNRLSKYVP